jgi:hypothetical protein
MTVRSWWRVAAVLCALALVTSGCGKKKAPAVPETAPSSAPAGPSLDPTSAAAASAALAAYRGYLSASAGASAAGDPQFPQLREYLAEPLLTQVQLGVNNNAKHGAMYQGEVGSAPRVTEVKLAAQPPSVKIEDCLDYSRYVLVYRTNQSPVAIPSAGPTRYYGTATAVRLDGGRWFVNQATTDRSRSC